jgi:5-methylcytosine-specific restriction endonuclease McrA
MFGFEFSVQTAPPSDVFTRFNVFLRDRFVCQHCGDRDDHLVPRSRGGHTTWINVVAACSPCNLRKGNLTPSEAKMWPSQMPFDRFLRFRML